MSYGFHSPGGEPEQPSAPQPEPVLGSPVPRRRSEEINRRARIYAWRMLLRFVCFGLVVVVPGWWKLVFVVGAVVLPYVAVVDANQRTAPEAGRRAPRDNGPALSAAAPVLQLDAPGTVLDGETAGPARGPAQDSEGGE